MQLRLLESKQIFCTCFKMFCLPLLRILTKWLH